MFLTSEELSTLTGKKSRGLQLAWLRHNKFPHEINAAGKPVVLRAYVEQRLGAAPAPLTKPRGREPNLTPDLRQASR